MKKHKIIVVVLIVGIIIAILIGIPLTILEINKKRERKCILHAGGSIDGLTYLNLQESFLYYYEKGYRLFEYDFLLSNDGKLIGTHNYEGFEGFDLSNGISYEEFNNFKINGKYTPVNEEWLIDTIVKFPDVKIIIDTKSSYEEIYERLENLNVDLKDNIIPQIYSKEMWDFFKNGYEYKQYIFSNYKENYSCDQILKYFDDERIFAITIPVWSSIELLRSIDEIKEKNKYVFIHTITTNFEYRIALFYGVDGIYVDNPFLFN